MGCGCKCSLRLSVMEELRENLCSAARADSRSSSVAPEEAEIRFSVYEERLSVSSLKYP